MAGPRGFIATSIGLIALEVVLTSDAAAFENIKSLLGVPGALAEAYLSPAVATLRPAGSAATALGAATGSAAAGVAQLPPGMFNVVPLPSQVPTPQVAPTPKPHG